MASIGYGAQVVRVVPAPVFVPRRVWLEQRLCELEHASAFLVRHGQKPDPALAAEVVWTTEALGYAVDSRPAQSAKPECTCLLTGFAGGVVCPIHYPSKPAQDS